MVEPEIAYMNLEELMNLAEDFVCYIVERILNERRKELETLERDVSKLEVVKKPFPRIDYNEAVELLHNKDSEFKYGDDFGAPEEALLTEGFDKPLLVHRWPQEVKAFYMKKDPQNHKLVLAVDMLAPEGYGEIIGGSQRENDYDALLTRIHQHNLPVEAFEWYLDLRKYGTVPHSGFGMGVERTVGWLTGTHHIRECIPFPRMMERIRP
jgi:asparaginyl-tRNA synthetase